MLWAVQVGGTAEWVSRQGLLEFAGKANLPVNE